MRGMVFKVLCATLLASALAFAQSGQSLGEIARKNREKQSSQEAAGTLPKVITNQDLPTDPGEIPESDASRPMTMVSGVSRPAEVRYSDRNFAQQNYANQRSGAQWRERIQMQESRIAELQSRIDQINSAMRNTNGGVQYERRYNRFQARQTERLAQMQEMLDQQRRRLDMMQEAARRASMHTNVYNP